ncbi:hypothetical protein [Bradyrhizobium sp. SZCCHNS2096]|uniref:hypothetical protein n=1 Tax=Bradyrhizobium sp. SZCCHNS2096 TaxID=3057309 RepID=UPI0029163EBD|nr:hypothetical protein [Bradyrhizobium sp. SZCCHNS2096]
MATVIADRKSLQEDSDGGVTVTFVENREFSISIRNTLAALRAELVVLGADFTIMEVDRFDQSLADNQPFTWEQLKESSAAIRARLAVTCP